MTKRLFDKILLSRNLYIGLSLVFILFSAILFQWGRLIKWGDKNYQLDNTLFGTYGDFVGGVLGTIFTVISVLLVIKTFKYQQEVTKSNERQLVVQRFNDLFFELLHLYQNEVSELCGQLNYPEDDSKSEAEIHYNNKDFFDVEKVIMQNNFRNKGDFEENQRTSVKYYMIFYIENRTKIAAYFRTLYRIYDLIDNADIEEKSKKNYLKIVRSQLTESELFFIRYNAMSYYGRKFIKYINKYHVLKHLPAFELLEFKDWWKDLNKIERTGLNIIFDNLNDILRRSLSDRNCVLRNDQGKYSFIIKIVKGYEVEIRLVIDSSKENRYMEYTALEKFDNEKIQLLLDCFIKEIFIYSNFSTLNKYNIETYSNYTIKGDDVVEIMSGIRNTQHNLLKLNSYTSNN